MYDEIKCEVKLPDTDQGEGVIFQTKSFPDACLQRYVITKTGRLIDPLKNDLEPDGSITFYTAKIPSDNKASLKNRWREYRAHFSKGQLVKITRVGADEDPGIRYGLASYRWFDTPSFNFSNLNNAEEQDDGADPVATSRRNLDEVSATGDSIIDALSYSDHGFPEIVTLAVHAVAARKILNDPSLIEQARTTLERWISRQRPAPEPLMEWRQILTGTPDQVAAVAMSLTEEATRLRSCSPLGFVLTHEERAAVYAAFGDKLKSIADYREEWRARE
jgi:hypothetical protein